MKPVKEYCRHPACQSFAAGSLSWMSDRLGRPELLGDALAIHVQNKEVLCQQVPLPRPSNHGRPNAPLPPTKEV